jgi:hypothetical protein
VNLTLYTVLTGIIACFSGCILIINSIKVKCLLKELLRSNKASIILLSIGLFWFQYHHVRNLGEADFGDYKLIIGLIGGFIAVASYFYINDFISVRAFCIIKLFYAREALDSAFLQEPSARLFLVTAIYFIIIVSLYFGAWPYRARDVLLWLNSDRKRSIVLGYSFLLYGLLLMGVAITY